MTQERKLAAIMFTDIVGYTSLMENDEATALYLLEINRQLIKSTVNQHHGHWIKELGDGTLTSFDSTLDALNCALKILKLIKEYPKLRLRIGLHLGDIILEDNDIFGDGVNIAARLQGQSPINGIAMSQHFHAQVHTKVSCTFESIGRPELKHVNADIEIFVWDPSIKNKTLLTKISSNREGKRLLKNPLFFAVTLSVAITLFYYYFEQNKAVPPISAEQDISAVKNNSTIEQASIAVLPFGDFSENHNAGYFGDGLTEELLNVLAKIKGLKVASRTSSFLFRDSTDSIRTIAKKLNVKHVLEGSVRRVKNKVRITAQLIDANNGYHLWSETYDKELDDIFAVQDQISNAVVLSLTPFLIIKPDIIITKSANNIHAYDYYLQGLKYLRKKFTVGSLLAAKELFERSIALDNQFSRAYAGLCSAHVADYLLTKKELFIEQAQSSCDQAFAIDPHIVEVHTAKAKLDLSLGQHDNAHKSIKSALAIAPNHVDAITILAQYHEENNDIKNAELHYKKTVELQPAIWDSHNQYGGFLLAQGKVKEAIKSFEQVIKLAPDNEAGYSNIGTSYYFLNRFDLAIKNWQRSLDIVENVEIYSNLGSLYFQLKQFKKAIKMFEKSVTLVPDNHIYWGNLADSLYFSNSGKTLANDKYLYAINLVENTLKINPNDIATLSASAIYYARIGLKDKAIASMSKALDRAPNDIFILYEAAIVYQQLEDVALTIEYLKKALVNGYPSDLIQAAPEFESLIKTEAFTNLFLPKT